MTFTKYNLYALAISIIGFFAFVLIYDELNSISPDFYYVAVVMFKRPAFWGALFLSLGVVMVLDFVAELFRKQFLYTPIEIGIEIER